MPLRFNSLCTKSNMRIRLRVRIYSSVVGGTGSPANGLDSLDIVRDVFIDGLTYEGEKRAEKLLPCGFAPFDLWTPVDDFSVVPRQRDKRIWLREATECSNAGPWIKASEVPYLVLYRVNTCQDRARVFIERIFGYGDPITLGEAVQQRPQVSVPPSFPINWPWRAIQYLVQLIGYKHCSGGLLAEKKRG